VLALGVGVLAACGPTTPQTTVDVPAASTVEKVAFAFPDSAPEITADDLAFRTRELADDKFAGRAPGDPVGEQAADWIAEEMARIGLKPAFGDSYFQNVEMTAQTVNPDASSLSIAPVGVTATPLKYGEDVVYWTKRQTTDPQSFTDSDVVFVGYGVVAPEANWNDYAGLDVRGKTVVILINDPGFATGDASLFKGPAMTYYGRWTYKFEEAARQGAAAALVVHETVPAAYGWDVVRGSWTGEQADLKRANAGADRVAMEGWLSLEAAQALFTASGLDFEAEKLRANRPGFTPVAMGALKASGTVAQSLEYRASRNVGGIVAGTTHPEEHVIMTAHWDHLGRKVNFATPGDDIYNGAIDNATGTAALLEIAEAAAGNPPQRSMLFLAVTLEESGLLGSAYYAENPSVDLARVPGGVNIDAMAPYVGRARDMVVVGTGLSDMEARLSSLLAARGRVITPDPSPQNGYFYRSDHISLAKKGVPMLYPDSGADPVEGGREAADALAAAYVANNYHKPGDEFDPSWDFSGMAEDSAVVLELIQGLANSRDWPEWATDAEFRTLREQTRAARTP
jgi:Zn-dependent M28 family amino/carboxypeptidase